MKLGDYVQDTISGFAGVVTARTDYLNGKVKYCVEPCELDDGKLIHEEWFDEYRLEQKPRPKKHTVGMTR